MDGVYNIFNPTLTDVVNDYHRIINEALSDGNNEIAWQTYKTQCVHGYIWGLQNFIKDLPLSSGLRTQLLIEARRIGK